MAKDAGAQLRQVLGREAARMMLQMLDKERQSILRMFPELADEEPEEPVKRPAKEAQVLYLEAPKKQKRLGDPKVRARRDRVLELVRREGRVTAPVVAKALRIHLGLAGGDLRYLKAQKLVRSVGLEPRTNWKIGDGRPPIVYEAA
jgi:predicted HTH transcriptional regulator